MLKTDNNFSEFKFQDLNVIASSLCTMENPLSLDGAMEKLEHFYLNQENYCMLLMTPIITDVLQLLPHQMGRELFQEVLKVKLEFGKYLNKLK
jgi:hypothetical protein